MMRVRNLAKIVLCVCLTGGHALSGVASGQPTPRPDSSSDAPSAHAADGGVIYLRLSKDGLCERGGSVPPPLPTPLVVLAPSSADRISALQRELARQLALKIDDLRAKIQVLNAQVADRSAPPPVEAPNPIEKPVIRPVASTEPVVLEAAPTASQREINRLITQCLCDLEKEVRELGDRVRGMTPTGK